MAFGSTFVMAGQTCFNEDNHSYNFVVYLVGDVLAACVGADFSTATDLVDLITF